MTHMPFSYSSSSQSPVAGHKTLPTAYSLRLDSAIACVRIMLVIATVLLSVQPLLANDVVLEFFTARSTGKDIRLEWRTSREVGIVRYEVERALASNTNDFRRVGTVEARGASQTYSFVDENAVVTTKSATASATMYVYRLRAVTQDGSGIHTQTVSVSHVVSSVRRTWGMIKEMFR